MGAISTFRGVRIVATATAFLGMVGLSSVASAVSFSGDFSVTAHSEGDGLVIGTSKIFDPMEFELLTVGESINRDLFRIWTDEKSVNADDFVPQNITVAFDFLSPVGAGTVEGQTAGAEVFFGLFQGGQVAWNEPTLISFDDGSQLSITLSGEDFNWGAFGLNNGEAYGAIVSANFELISDSAAVIPLPAGLPLLLSGIGGLALLRRRRNAAAA